MTGAFKTPGCIFPHLRATGELGTRGLLTPSPRRLSRSLLPPRIWSRASGQVPSSIRMMFHTSRSVRTQLSFATKCEQQHRWFSCISRSSLISLKRAEKPKAPARPWALRFTRRQYSLQNDSRKAESLDLGQDQIPGSEYDPVDSVRPTSLLRPILFTIMATAGLYFGAAAMTKRFDDRFQQSIQELLRDGKIPPNPDWRSEISFHQKLRTLGKMNSLGVPGIVSMSYLKLYNWWDKQRSSQRAVWILSGLNFVVFLAFRIPVPLVRLWMQRSFTHSPLTGRSYTLLTSTFGHSSLAHFAFNMLALNSFGPMAFEYLEKQRRRYPWVTDDDKIMNPYSTYHHIAFFVSAGVLASLVPHIVDLMYKLPVIQGSMRSATERVGVFIGRRSPSFSAESAIAGSPQARILPSLGASGGIYSMLVLSALAFPDTTVSLIFLPWIPIDIGRATLAVVTFDVLGIIRGWQVFGHWAHLTGGAVGALAYWGEGRLWFEVQRILEGSRLEKYDGTPWKDVVRFTDKRGAFNDLGRFYIRKELNSDERGSGKM